MAGKIRAREISSVELVNAHLRHIEQINPALNAAVEVLGEAALCAAHAADQRLAAGDICGPLHGVPISVKDSIEVGGSKTTAGTLGRRKAPAATRDAVLVRRLRTAGAIPIAKTNLPDLLFSYETDNLIYGRTNNPYDLTRTPGGSSGGESALIAACGSPLGLGSDAAGSVRVPAAFCGIASIKPTSGRLPRTGHVPPAGGWAEALWQIGPMARHAVDLELAMQILAGEDEWDFTAPPVPLLESNRRKPRIAFFTDNGFATCTPEVQGCVKLCAKFLSENGFEVEERRPPGIDQAFELELALLGADGADSIDSYLSAAGSTQIHPYLNAFLEQMRPFRTDVAGLAARWAQWDEYRANLCSFFGVYAAILSPVYTQPALMHGASVDQENFRGFSYTMAWNVAGAPAATVCCGSSTGLPLNVQVVTKPWHDLLAVQIIRKLESGLGGWQAPPNICFV
jgi:amidase